MLEKKNTEIPIEISQADLSPDALNGIIENFILREGTDYGIAEVAYEQKAKQILKQIQSGRVKIYFDQESETISLLTESMLRTKTPK